MKINDLQPAAGIQVQILDQNKCKIFDAKFANQTKQGGVKEGEHMDETIAKWGRLPWGNENSQVVNKA